MRIILTNEYGSFEMGGGGHPMARVYDIAGIGLPSKETQSVVFAGQSGRTVTDIRDVERTITIGFDFYGGVHEIEKLYKCIYHPVEIQFFTGSSRRKISGRCVAATDIEKIIYHRWSKLVLQFVCDDPYFRDLYPEKIGIAAITDKLPNVYEDGEWYVSLPAVATERVNSRAVRNYGDTVIYPVIRLYNNKEVAATGNITVTNETTGKAITLEYLMSANEEVTVDIPRRTITSDVSGDITNYISDDTALGDFFLAIGENTLSAASSGETDDIIAELEFYNNYIAVVI